MSKPERIPPRATYEDLKRVPDHKVAELVAGELIVSPRPAARHAVASSRLTGALTIFDRKPGGNEPGGWHILIEPELHFGEDVLVPDLAGWRHERMPLVPDVAFFTLAPDWICEVMSPSTRAFDRVRKLPIYAREGVGHAWLLDPIDKVLEVYRRDAAGWLSAGAYQGALKVRAEPFEAIEIDLAR
ncbi:MAG TPA: Uma2 family endonuclease, partial [Myxococcales bacterium]|nr:Uma2 family endonuclease [Myxococcales bacterium]